MPDREKVMRGLWACGNDCGVPNICEICECPYGGNCPACVHLLARDAFELLATELLNEHNVGRFNAHEVACILAEVMGDDCACNFHDHDEWLPQYCEFAETSCPNPAGVACWEQYLKHLDKKTQRKETEWDA